MADKDNRTEKPTAKRLSEAREKGQVPQSQEMLSAVSLVTLLGMTYFLGPWFIETFKTKIREGFSCNYTLIDNSQSLMAFVNSLIIDAMTIMAPFLIALVIAGCAGTICIGGGFNLSTKSLQPKISDLNPIKGLQKLFSPESLVKLFFSIVKLVVISTIVWMYLKDRFEELARLQWIDPQRLLNEIGYTIFHVVFRIILGLIVIGVADLIYQKWRYIQKLKMSKQEIKDEHRNHEGPPEIKNKIRQKQFQAAMQRMLQDVPKADVVLVNPDHVAVAIQYDPATMAAPIVLAKGGDHLCEKIKEIARSYGVPILRRPPLARELFAKVKIGNPIPEKLFRTVAEILALIYRLKQGR